MSRDFRSAMPPPSMVSERRAVAPEAGPRNTFLELLAVALKFRMFSQRTSDFAQDARRVFVRWLGKSIMHPFAFAARRDYAGSSKIGQVARNLWLTRFQNRDQKTHANLRIAKQANQPQPGAVGQGFEKIFDVVGCLCHD